MKGKPTEIACGQRLTQKRATTLSSFLATGKGPPFSWGIALDNVTAVSFVAGGQEVTVPVEDNVWAYHGKKDLIGAVPLTVHFTDGSTESVRVAVPRPGSGGKKNLRRQHWPGPAFGNDP